ncbi:MAG: PD40 domain-containing protein [Anaerolineae bacterium]|nr:MAG: PD40 domain-containing protein [Anaerolineae bacterium]
MRNVAEASSGPAWSSDGTTLAFTSRERNGSALHTFDVARNTARRCTGLR